MMPDLGRIDKRRRGRGGAIAGRGALALPLALALALAAPSHGAPASSPAENSDGVPVATPPTGVADGRPDWRDPRARPGARDAAPGNAPPELGRLGPQRLVVGRRWRLHARARDADGPPPRLLVSGLPPGASLSKGRRGWHLIEWTPPPDATGVVTLTVEAVDARDPSLRVARAVPLRIEPAPPSGRPGSGAVPAPESPRAAVAAREPAPLPPAVEPRDAGPLGKPPAAPRFEPLAAQIVSAGRVVVSRVLATLEDGRRVPLQIDRLPRHASFDENADGSRTFHWPTGQGDEGEHRFRITARHPDHDDLASRAEMLVVVGDPTRASTAPLEPTAIGPSPSPIVEPPEPTLFGEAGYRGLGEGVESELPLESAEDITDGLPEHFPEDGVDDVVDAYAEDFPEGRPGDFPPDDVAGELADGFPDELDGSSAYPDDAGFFDAEIDAVSVPGVDPVHEPGYLSGDDIEPRFDPEPPADDGFEGVR